MTKYRIKKIDDGVNCIFQIQRALFSSPFISFWVKHPVFYKSEFENMPGWMTSNFNSAADAFEMLNVLKTTEKKKVETTIIYSD